MSNETPPPEELSAEVEARIIAWILGEASPFEAAEMERLCANDARAAKYRSEMHTLSALVSDASHPPSPEEKLSPSRRDELLAALGAPAARSEKVVSLPYVGLRSTRLSRSQRLLIIGAALAACFVAAFTIRMSVTSTLGPSNWAKSQAGDGTTSKALSQPDVAFQKKIAAERAQKEGKELREVELPSTVTQLSPEDEEATPQPTLMARLTAPNGAGADVSQQPPIRMQPFQVTSSADTGYTATETLAGSRVRTNLSTINVDKVDVLSDLKSDHATATVGSTDAGLQTAVPTAPGAVPEPAAPKKDDTAVIELSPFVISTGPSNKRVAATLKSDPSELVSSISVVDANTLANLAKPNLPVIGGLSNSYSSAKNASTFALHVGDASYRLANETLNRGELPDPAKIRPEEFYNAFDYGDPQPLIGEAIAFRSEQCADAFLQGMNLLRLALKVPSSGRSLNQPLRLTILLDTSGSMQRADRAAEVRQAFSALANVLKPADRVTLIGFARTPRLLADRVAGNQAGQLNSVVARTPADGGTNLELALTLAAESARKELDPTVQNRVVILTDGAANLGNLQADALGQIVAGLRQEKISFDACAIGMDSASDALLETLTRKGEGHYYLVNSTQDVDRQFVRGLAGAMHPEATDVKLQVKFNPRRVNSYRLLGFDQYRVSEQDFRNDRVAGADLAADQGANALYNVQVNPSGDGDLGRVFVRFRQTATGRTIERSWPLPYLPAPPAFAEAPASLQLAGSANYLAEKLRNDRDSGDIQLKALVPAVDGLRSYFPGNDEVGQFIQTFNQANAAGAGPQH